MKIQAATDISAYAWRKIDLTTPVGGKALPVTVVLRTPFECEDEHWLCAVSLSGLTHRKRDVRGATAEASLAKAKTFALNEMRRYVAQGGVLENSESGPIKNLSSLFA